MPGHTIALPSLLHFAHESDDDLLRYVRASSLDVATLMRIERAIAASCADRSALRNRDPWSVVAQGLREAGFEPLRAHEVTPADPIFMYPKPFDEAWGSSSHSFFVTFEDTAPHEIAGQLVIATNYPGFWTQTVADFAGADSVVLISPEQEAIYPDDLAYADTAGQEQIPIGTVIVPHEQFISEQAHRQAMQKLANSGYAMDFEFA